MATKILAGDLVDIASASDAVGVTAASWRSMVSRGDGPPPAIHIGFAPFWTWQVLEAWGRARPRHPLILRRQKRRATGAESIPAEDLMDVNAAAEWAEMKPMSWRRQVARKHAPQPLLYVGAHPMWTEEQLAEWWDTRPGGGRPVGTTKEAMAKRAARR